MEQPSSRGATLAQRHRWVFDYSLDGDLRFISHHDTLRLFQRALARAALPVRFSEGFNPHPKMTIPLPRPLGIASDAEMIVIEFEEDMALSGALEALQQQMPHGLRLLGIRPSSSGQRFGGALVRYQLRVDSLPTDLPSRMQEVMDAKVLEIERKSLKRGTTRRLDVRPFVESLMLVDGVLEFTLRATETGSVKPAELAGLLGFEAGAINHRIRRLEVQWL